MNKYYKAIVSANFKIITLITTSVIWNAVGEEDGPIESIGDTDALMDSSGAHAGSSDNTDEAKTTQLLKEQIRVLHHTLLQNHATRFVFLQHITDQFSPVL